jgi:hypothetical protein
MPLVCVENPTSTRPCNTMIVSDKLFAFTTSFACSQKKEINPNPKPQTNYNSMIYTIKFSSPLLGASKCKHENTFNTHCCYSSQQFLKERQQEPTCPPTNSKERGREECIICQEATNFLKVQ